MQIAFLRSFTIKGNKDKGDPWGRRRLLTSAVVRAHCCAQWDGPVGIDWPRRRWWPGVSGTQHPKAKWRVPTHEDRPRGP